VTFVLIRRFLFNDKYLRVITTSC